MKIPNYRPFHFYSKVGKPELVFFITLSADVFLPFIFNFPNNLIPSILLTLFIFSVQYLIYLSSSKIKKTISALLLLILVISWLRYFNFDIPQYIIAIDEIILMIISFFFISRSIFNTNEVDINTVLASVSCYLLIGISMGLMVSIMQNFRSDSFSFPNDVSNYNAIYYSFVTMSTLGYGDIVPLSKSAKGLSIVISLIGQFYMVIVMGLIIGKLIASKEKK